MSPHAATGTNAWLWNNSPTVSKQKFDYSFLHLLATEGAVVHLDTYWISAPFSEVGRLLKLGTEWNGTGRNGTLRNFPVTNKKVLI